MQASKQARNRQTKKLRKRERLVNKLEKAREK